MDEGSQGNGQLSPSARCGRAYRGGNTQYKHQSVYNKRSKQSNLEKPLRTHFNKWNMMETYPKGAKGGTLCSVLSPKPKSDLKNRMLTPTILIVLL